MDGGEHEDGGNGESDHLGVAEEWVDTPSLVCAPGLIDTDGQRSSIGRSMRTRALSVSALILQSSCTSDPRYVAVFTNCAVVRAPGPYEFLHEPAWNPTFLRFVGSALAAAVLQRVTLRACG